MFDDLGARRLWADARFSYVTFLSAGFRMSDGSFPSNSARNICVKTAKDHTKIRKREL